MSEHLGIDKLRQLKVAFLKAFQTWLDVPRQILVAGAEADISPRKEMCAFLEFKWHKLWQDMSGVLCLINTNHIGPAVALSRVCRETALRMIVWSFSDASLDQAHLHVAQDVRPKTNAKRLLRDMQAFLALCGDSLHPTASGFLQTAIDAAQGIVDQPDLVPCDNMPPTVQGMGFASLTRDAIKRMMVNGLDPSILARQVVDYWLECEAVHTGEGAEDLYKPVDYGQGMEMNAEITYLARLNGLYPLKAMVTAALVNAVGFTGKLPKPKASKDLETVASTAEQVVVAFRAE